MKILHSSMARKITLLIISFIIIFLVPAVRFVMFRHYCPWDTAHNVECIYCEHGKPYYYVLEVSQEPLFNVDGTINQATLTLLNNILFNQNLDPFTAQESPHLSKFSIDNRTYMATTAKDFSNFVRPYPTCMSHSGSIVLRLFETIYDSYGVHNGHLTEFTNSWWQLVYRTTSNDEDVLTIWMVEPYRLSVFNGTRHEVQTGQYDERFLHNYRGLHWQPIPTNATNTIYSDWCITNSSPPSQTYFFDNNYSTSIIRSNLLRDFSIILDTFDICDFLVAPRYLPGQWQSSVYQTGTNIYGRYFYADHFQTYLPRSPDTPHRYYRGSHDRNNGLGATGLIWGNYFHFSLNNGLDGLSIGSYHGGWQNSTAIPSYYDLIWLPSDFETRTMGTSNEIALFQTFIADPTDESSRLRWNYWGYERDPRQDLTNGRSGLWHLNGFDRAFDQHAINSQNFWESRLVWLRSVDSLAVGNVNMIFHTGNRYGYGVIQLAGVRPAVHLCLMTLTDALH